MISKFIPWQHGGYKLIHFCKSIYILIKLKYFGNWYSLKDNLYEIAIFRELFSNFFVCNQNSLNTSFQNN